MFGILVSDIHSIFSQQDHLQLSLGGQRRIRPFWRNYFENTDVLVGLLIVGRSIVFCGCFSLDLCYR